MDQPARPLDDVRILDLTRVVAGPSCTKALADLGAEVIKLEPPAGDTTRHAHPRVGGMPVYFAQLNTGKRCISIDLGTEAGREVAFRLATRVDVVVENFRPGVADRLGLGYEAVREANPSVVYCSISGYGQTGTWAGRRAYAPMMHAELGLIELTARRRGTPPLPEAISHADLHAGLQATIGILAALRHRERTGVGQHVDVSMAETMLAATEWTAVEVAGGEGDNFHPFGGANAPMLRLGDGTVVCVPGDPVSTFPGWCAAMQRPELADDPRFVDRPTRARHRAELLAVLQEWAAGFESFDRFEDAVGRGRMAAGAVRSLNEALSQPWAEERQALVDVGGERGTIRVPRSPLRFSSLEVGSRPHPSAQGEDNAAVLRDLLDLDQREVDRLTADGVLIERPLTAGE